MKLEIYSDSKPVTKSPVALMLKERADGIEVVVVDAVGETIDAGHLIRFNTFGGIFRYPGIYGGFGFDLDGSDRIKIQ